VLVVWHVTFDVMGQHESTPPAAKSRPRFGKDHLMLADWPISVATYQQRTKADGTKLDNAQYVVTRSNGTSQRVVLEAPSSVGLPGAGDSDFLVALLTIAKQQGFESDIVRFIPSHVLAVMRLAATKKNYERLKNALKRLRALTLTYELAWYSRRKRAVEPILITGILAEAKLVFRRGRRASGAVADSHIQWTRNFYTSLKEGNLTDLDLDLYFGWKRPGCKQLYRHLNKVWHAGKRPKVYERDLTELASAHLGLARSKFLKRNFQEIIKDMEENGYLAPMDKGIRYRKIRPGVWRVRLELHPRHFRGKRAGGGESSREDSTPRQPDAAVLVCDYHRHRFGRETYDPKSHELRHAEKLLSGRKLSDLEKLLPGVAKTVAGAYSGKDCHFGAAVPYFEKALQDHEQHQRSRRREREQTAGLAAIEEGTAAERQARRQRRLRLLKAWQKLSVQQQSRYQQAAIARAASDSQRRHLTRHTDLEEPPTQVLEEMARALGA